MRTLPRVSADPIEPAVPGGSAPARIDRTRPLDVGGLAPWFRGTTRSRNGFMFDTVAGRHVLFCFPGTWDEAAARVVHAVLESHASFDDERLCFFGVRNGAGTLPELPPDRVPGIRFFLDPEGLLCRLFGTVRPDGSLARIAYLLDPALRVKAVFDLGDLADAGLPRLRAAVAAVPPVAPPRPGLPHAPVLSVPDVFEPGLCRALIEYYESAGGVDSGFMREVDGLTVGMIDHRHKRRRDRVIEDEKLRRAAMVRIHERLLPQMERAFQFRATRMERYIVSCYDASERGMFRAHRDNTTRGTAHRRFAVSLFLNEGYEGGRLVFAEYGPETFGAPAGGAVVFSCSMLHEALPVTSGRRYMFLPFLYDEAARQQRTDNLGFLGTNEALGGQ